MSGMFDFALECLTAYSQIARLYRNQLDMQETLRFVGLPKYTYDNMCPAAVVEIMEALLKKVREECDKKP